MPRAKAKRKPLSAKILRFVAEYALKPNGAEAAVKAGYSKRTAKQQASRLLTNVDVREAVEAARARLEKPSIASVSQLREFWTRTMQSGDIATKDRLKASELLGKSKGAFLKRIDLGVSRNGRLIGRCPAESERATELADQLLDAIDSDGEIKPAGDGEGGQRQATEIPAAPAAAQ